MAGQKRPLRSIAWAWAAGWALASIGLTVSDAYSSPNRGLAAAYGLGFAGWAFGAAVTVRLICQRSRADVYVMALSIAGWSVGTLVAVVVGLAWLFEWDLGFFGPIVAAALGGAIGGGLTLPVRSLSSPTAILRLGVWNAACWGAAFLGFQLLAFYTGYILVQLTVNPLVPIVGHGWAKVPGWALPAGLGGLLAGLLATRSSQWMERKTAA